MWTILSKKITNNNQYKEERAHNDLSTLRTTQSALTLQDAHPWGLDLGSHHWLVEATFAEQLLCP